MENSEFDNRVKSSFSKVKEDIDDLRSEIDNNKKKIIELLDLMREFLSKYESKPNKEYENPTQIDSSIGNQGVIPLTHSLTHIPLTHKFAFLEALEAFSARELYSLLSLYQLEEEKGKVTYLDIAEKLSLKESGVRSYISALIKKGAPITRKKINNRLTILSIDEKFRNLGLKTKLVNLYYQRDPEQKRLSDI